MTRVIALIDGEHYPPVVKDALDELEKRNGYETAAVVFIGGTEKISEKGELDLFGCPVVIEKEALGGILKAIDIYRPEAVVDLSDEPVIGYVKRLSFASHVLNKGIPYIGADFRFDPPELEEVLKKPSIGIIGTGKRVGKTAISGHICRILDSTGFNPCVIAMGRGGPKDPEIIKGREIELTPEFLLDLANSGKHAASDYLEDALTSRITAIGCRRCGGGMAGNPFVSNVVAGAELANRIDSDFVVLEGSGAAIPPVQADGYILTINASQPMDYVTGYFGTYRVLISDLVIISMCEPPLADGEKIEQIDAAIRKIKPGIKIVHTKFRPKPLKSIEDKRVFLATTAPESTKDRISGHLEEWYGAKVVGASCNLSNRSALRRDIEAAGGTFTTLLTELKAAAVDVVTSIGLEMGLEVVYMDNIPVTTGGDGDLDQLVLDLGETIKEGFMGRRDN